MNQYKSILERHTVEKIIWSPADFVCFPTDKEIISLYILMVGLFEKWETE